jgi:hypothetical protein
MLTTSSTTHRCGAVPWELSVTILAMPPGTGSDELCGEGRLAEATVSSKEIWLSFHDLDKGQLKNQYSDFPDLLPVFSTCRSNQK